MSMVFKMANLENHPTEPMNLYAISKDCLRRTIKNMCERVNVKWCWLRIFYPMAMAKIQIR